MVAVRPLKPLFGHISRFLRKKNHLAWCIFVYFWISENQVCKYNNINIFSSLQLTFFKYPLLAPANSFHGTVKIFKKNKKLAGRLWPSRSHVAQDVTIGFWQGYMLPKPPNRKRSPGLLLFLRLARSQNSPSLRVGKENKHLDRFLYNHEYSRS